MNSQGSPFYLAIKYNCKHNGSEWYKRQLVVVFVFKVPPTAKVIWRLGHGLKSHPTDLWRPGIEPATPGLQGKLFIHYTTAAP